MSKESSLTSSSTESERHSDPYLKGDPDCPHCGGVGYVRNDQPVGHPDFGKLQVCVCRQAEVNQLARKRLFALSNLDELRDLTFNNFDSRGQQNLGPTQADSVEIAFQIAKQFAETTDGWLLLQGGYGCGKTHLAAAIANAVVGRGVSTLFITVPDLLDSLRFAYDNPDTTFEKQFEQIRNVPLLILDDFGTQNATNWAQEKLFQIINYRYINRLPLVVTTNGKRLEHIEERIRSRLRDLELVTVLRILAPDYRRSDDTGHHPLSSLMHFRDSTFGNFDTREGENLEGSEVNSLKKAFDAAHNFAERPEGWLVLTGPYGCGKSYLAAAIANYRTGLGQPPLFVNVPDLLDHLRATFNPDSPVRYDQLFDDVRTTRLLILDDLGTQSTTAWAREKLYQLFNHRYNAKLPTVITTSDSIAEMDARLRSRMLDTRLCLIHAITAPTYTGRGQKQRRK